MLYFNKDIDVFIENFLEYGEFGILKLLSKKYYHIYKSNSFNLNGFIRNKKTSRWYIDYVKCKYNLSDLPLKWAIKKEYINVIHYLKNKWNKFTLKHAIRTRKIKSITYLIKNKCAINCYSFSEAASIGDITLLEILKNNNCKSNIFASCLAAKKGNINTLKWLINNNYKYNETTIQFAASGGKIDILNYLKNVNCPYNNNIFLFASKNNNLHVLNWLWENNYQYIFDVNDFKKLMKYSKHESLIWILNHYF